MGKIKDLQLKAPKILKVGEDDFSIYAYKETKAGRIAYWVLTIFTLGFFNLFAHWIKSLLIRVRYEECDGDEADIILIKDNHEVSTIKNVIYFMFDDVASRPMENGQYEKITAMRFFYYRKIKYIWYEAQQQWINPADLDSVCPFNAILKRAENQDGLSEEEIKWRHQLYGHNSLDVQLTPLIQVLISEVLTPFYLFQALSVTLWYSDHYAYYASVIVLITILSAAIAVWQTRVQQIKVRSMIGGGDKMLVTRGGKKILIDSSELATFDIFPLPQEGILQCDALLLTGSVIVNEAMLTGESLAVTKVPLSSADEVTDDVRLSAEKHNRHTLFCGTRILQTRYYKNQEVTAMVIRTGFSTLKGQLVRAIMYPKPMDAQYMADLFRFILFLAGIAGLGFVYTIVLMITEGAKFLEILVKTLDIVTIVVPPALPAAMSVGIINANYRLRQKNIYCISPTTINTCGQINAVCFDKTGTLTEDGLNFNCLRAVKSNQGKFEFSEELSELSITKMKLDGINYDVIAAAATCHSLTRIDGTVHGDPLDHILFMKSGWDFQEAAERTEETELFDNVQPTVVKPPAQDAEFYSGNREFSVIRQFPFSSALQRMAVVVSSPNEKSEIDLSIYAKGSPEMIKSLCDQSTIPESFSAIVDGYARKGYRLIAIASKKIPLNYVRAMKAPREQIECDLVFLGIVVMENQLKDVTLGVINVLCLSNIRTIMVTGDNLLTAMSVARECGIIRPSKKTFVITHDTTKKDHLGRTLLEITERVSSSESEVDTDSEVRSFDRKIHLQPAKYHLAIAGSTYAVVVKEYPELVDRITAVCDVYARMAPDQKSALIVALQALNYKVAMCGDGANDCAALKAADAGISLSDAEASIAAPFTSKTADIRCVVEVIREGRCALVTSYSVFKYMAAYSLNEFLSVMILYYISSNLSDGQFLFIDLMLITVVAMFLGNTGPADTLSPIPPPTRLATLSSFSSVVGQFLINFGIQLISVFLIRGQSWYVDVHEKYATTTMEGTGLFATCAYMYLGFAFVYSKGAPYRKNVFTNYALCAVIFVIGAITSAIVLLNVDFINMLMGFQPLPFILFRLLLIALGFVGVFISIIYEHVFVQGVIANCFERKTRERRLRNQDTSLPLFERLLFKIGSQPTWFNESVQAPNVSQNNETK